MAEGGSVAHPVENSDKLRGAKILGDQREPGETATIRCGTTKGDFVAKFYHDWSPHGYDRATALFQKGFYDHSHFFRVVPKFLVQFGISYTDSKALKAYANTPIPDDPVPNPKIPFHKGTMSFAGSGPNSRTSQMFVSYGDSTALGRELWETPFGEVIEGMEHIEELYSYGDMPPWGKGPVQGKIHNNPDYIPNEFPLLDKFETCTVTIQKPGELEGGLTPEEEKEEQELDEPADKEEEEEEEGAVGRGELHAHRAAVEDNTDDSPKTREQRQLKAALEAIGPFEDLVQVGVVVAGIIVMVLGVAAISRKGRKKKHAH